jgi:hypothetical protein
MIVVIVSILVLASWEMSAGASYGIASGGLRRRFMREGYYAYSMLVIWLNRVLLPTFAV